MTQLLIDKLKSEGITIRHPTVYYAEAISRTIYISMADTESMQKQGLVKLLKTIALMEGDFDDGSGMSKVDTFRHYMGQATFENYKNEQPQKYQYLVDMDKEGREE